MRSILALVQMTRLYISNKANYDYEINLKCNSSVHDGLQDGYTAQPALTAAASLQCSTKVTDLLAYTSAIQNGGDCVQYEVRVGLSFDSIPKTRYKL
jgi:hypothetical protein